MQQPKLCNLNSKSIVKYNNLKSFPKKSDPRSSPKRCGTQHINVLGECIGEVLRCDRTAKPSTRICGRSEHIEDLKYLIISNKGDFQYA